MSLLQELGAQLRATSEELPTGLVSIARERLNSAAELLNWVRQTSVDPLGVPQLGNAVEQAESAAAALRLAQDAIASYLAAVGLTGEAAAPPDTDYKAALKPDEAGISGAQKQPPPEKLGPWWQSRVAELTGEAAPPEKQDGTPQQGRSGDTAELLRRVAAGVRSGDRARVGRDLHEVDAATGLGLSAVSSPVLQRLAADLLGHEPGPDDLKRLQSAAGGRVRALLPGTPPDVLDTMLARICRSPVTSSDPAHPADSAVTAGVLTGVLLARLGRDPSTLDPKAPEPLRPRGVDA
ncbi:hypothetical protein [Winogradskya humida]|uniref:DUF222 domain-containing protein n=1 Tax=Winogradskya humida TaxID=113566 RepID=A0ABQ3ZUY1_9ACTN|nr:hypothetical protein [Actinoplanes humidus]GIE22384.1 hypothetical protein Ahu01nite_054860 [Actinoplanes humidus]